MKVAVLVGTRPEVIKMAPVIRGLHANHVDSVIVASGQHPELAEQALRALDLRADVALPRVSGRNLGERLAALLSQISTSFAEIRPGFVLVHGDTATTLAGALAAHQARAGIGHVEAGLRSGDRANPFPEEDYRRTVDHLSTVCFAPTERAAKALDAEGIPRDRVLVTGNPLVDVVRATARAVEPRACASFPELAGLDLDDSGPVVLVTAHRRESWGTPLRRICQIVERLPARVVWPVHPSPDVEGPVRERLGKVPHVKLVSPLSYPAMVRLMLRSDLILTDSGGLQEEGAILGRSTLVLRERTERPEALDSGVVRVVGTQIDDVLTAANAWIRRSPTLIIDGGALGDGHAGERIARWIAAALG